MRKSKQTAIVIAVIMIAVGLVAAFGAMADMGFDFTKMNSRTFVTNTYSVDESFSGISVDGAECDIRLYPSEDGGCKVVCHESDRITHSVEVKENTLTVERHDNRKWYEHMGVYWGGMEIALYLPQREYDALYAKTLSGNIVIPEDFSFETAVVQSTSGNVSFSAEVGGNLKVKAVSGNVELIDVTGQSISVQTTSGEIDFSNVIAGLNIHCKSVSGDVVLRRCDADSLRLSSTSGNITGSLLTEKVFLTDTTSGKINVPRTTSGGQCEITTTSGNIEFEVE